MTKFDRIDAQRMLTAAAGAFLLSSACVLSAVGPARAAEPATTGEWQQRVERQIEANLRMPTSVRSDVRGVATVRIRFDEAGRFDGATIVRSTGNPALDEEALRTARAIRYPALPAGDRAVAMQLYFGQHAPSKAAVREQATAAIEADATRRIQTAGLPQG